MATGSRCMSDYRKDICHSAIGHKVGEHVAPDGRTFVIYETTMSVDTCLAKVWDEALPALMSEWQSAVDAAAADASREEDTATWGIVVCEGRFVSRVTKTQIVVVSRYGTEDRYRRLPGRWASDPVGQKLGRNGWRHDGLSAEVIAAVEARAGGRDVVDFIAEGIKAAGS